MYGKGNRWAILVGINEYSDKIHYGNLNVCMQDVINIRKVLLQGGFEASRIQLLTDKHSLLPLKENIIAALQSVAQATEPDDLLLFYFSGHGSYERGESYLIPHHGKGIILYDTALAISRVKEIMGQAQAQSKVIILDACHSGLSVGTKGSEPMAGEFIKYVFAQSSGMAILSSCTQGQLSHEWKERSCSVFTYYLLEALHGLADRDNKGCVTVTDVNMYVTSKVKLWASQHQVSQTPTLNYLVIGDIPLVNYAKPNTHYSNIETGQHVSPLYIAARTYLDAVQEATTKALHVFESETIWIAHCQPLLQTFSQIDQPVFFSPLSTLSHPDAQLYSSTLKLHNIVAQTDRVTSLIRTFTTQEQVTKKHRETQIKAIKSILTSLLHEINTIYGLIASLENVYTPLEEKNISLTQQKDIYPYLGDLEAQREGRTYQDITNSLLDMGIQPKKNVQMPREDMLERFRRVPLHALFLYTSEDQEIHNYITKHWGAIDGMTRDDCDIHPMLNQFNNIEDAYTYLEKLDVVRQSGFQAVSHLPILFFYDNQGTNDYISFGINATEADIKRILRIAFDEIRQQPTISSVTRARQLLEGGDRSSTMKQAVQIHQVKAGNVARLDSLPEVLSNEQNELLEELKSMPTGDGTKYEELVKKILYFCLADDFASFEIKEQVRTYNQKRRRDFIIDNKNSKVDFWRELKVVRSVEKILFDAKNYENQINYAEITSTLRYLKNKAFGNFMIIISRQGLKDCEEFIEDYGDGGQIVLFLSDDDLVNMINRKRMGGNVSSLIEEKYYSFLDMK